MPHPIGIDRRISVSSGRKELSVSAKILNRLSSCGRTSKANGVNQIALGDIFVALVVIGVSQSIHDLLFQTNRDGEQIVNLDGGEASPNPPDEGLTSAATNENQNHHHYSDGHLRTTALYLLFGSIMFFQAIQLVLGFILLRGSIGRHKGHCKVWLIVQIILLILEVTLFAVFATIIPSRVATWGWSIVFLLSILYKIYCVYVVKAFLVELQKKKMRKASQSGPPLIPVAINEEDKSFTEA
jgi:hypothetical protein